MILGIDEVGRGPWAGPLVVGAVVLPDGVVIEGITDSKKLTAKKRVLLDEQIKTVAAGWGLGWVHAYEIDSIGLAEALRLATIRAVEAVTSPYHEIIIDGTINFLKETSKGQFVTTLPKADLLVPAVSAASIIAKVARDDYMEEQDNIYPGYGFSSHVGYGTAKHTDALNKLGVTPLHRKSFAPIAKIVSGSEIARVAANISTVKTATSIGSEAEAKVVDYLVARGYQVVERNWKTRYCEIDIIACKNNDYIFVEVKYRSSSLQGGGLAAVTKKKLDQMKFAAELYAQRQHITGGQQLMVASVDSTGNIELLEV